MIMSVCFVYVFSLSVKISKQTNIYMNKNMYVSKRCQKEVHAMQNDFFTQIAQTYSFRIEVMEVFHAGIMPSMQKGVKMPGMQKGVNVHIDHAQYTFR